MIRLPKRLVDASMADARARGWTPDAQTITLDQFPLHWLLQMSQSTSNPQFQEEIDRRCET